MRGTVRAISFRGSYYRIVVVVEDQLLTIQTSEPQLSIGDTVYLALSTGKTVYL
ncbi:MAG: TOBE domain-containing protein [Chitinophagaceae bacterium]